ncbi:DNAH6, partial [Symbiodinium necroappetens]
EDCSVNVATKQTSTKDPVFRVPNNRNYEGTGRAIGPGVLMPETLNAHLFALDPTLCRRECVKISSWNLLEVNPMTVYQVEEFEEQQRQKRKQMATDLQEVWEKIKDELHQSCTSSLQDFLKKNGFGQRGSGEEEKEVFWRVVSRAVKDGGGMSYTERATTRTQCRKLTKFIRMVQFLFNDAVSQMVVRTTTTKFQELLDAFVEDVDAQEAAALAITEGEGEKPSEEKKEESKGGRKPNFNVECLLEHGALVFKPSGKRIWDAVESALRDALRAVSGCHAFLQAGVSTAIGGCDLILTEGSPVFRKMSAACLGFKLVIHVLSTDKTTGCSAAVAAAAAAAAAATVHGTLS